MDNRLEIKIVYRNKTERKFESASEEFNSYIRDGFNENTIFYLHIVGAESDLQIEFGNKCCNIQIGDDRAGEAYMYLDPHATKEFVDLYANCYPRNMLCLDIEIVLKIVQTFTKTGKPDADYLWNIIDL